MLQLTNQLLSTTLVGSKASPAKVGSKIGIKLTAQQVYGLKMWRDGLVKISVTAEEIDLAYADCTASSCMKGEKVGEYYSKAGVVCIHTPNARALVNPEDRLFYKVYGADHAPLSALLELCGYIRTEEWLPCDMDTRLLVKKTKKVLAPYVVSSLTQVWYTEREVDCYYLKQQGVKGFKQPVLQRRTRKFVDIALKEKEIFVWERDDKMYIPYVDGDTAQRPPTRKQEEGEWDEVIVPFRAKVIKGAKQALRNGKKIKLAA